jgi:hypothetical protein
MLFLAMCSATARILSANFLVPGCEADHPGAVTTPTAHKASTGAILGWKDRMGRGQAWGLHSGKQPIIQKTTLIMIRMWLRGIGT